METSNMNSKKHGKMRYKIKQNLSKRNKKMKEQMETMGTK
jgi:hypothetical protein